jgi:hypothetical protein
MLSLPIRSMRGGLNAPTACSDLSGEGRSTLPWATLRLLAQSPRGCPFATFCVHSSSSCVRGDGSGCRL